MLRLRTLLVTSGVAMVLLGYVGQFRLGRDDSWALLWGTASTIPFVVLLAVLLPLLRAQSRLLPGEAGTTVRHLRGCSSFFWGLYPIAYLVPVVSSSTQALVVSQALFTVADLGSKVLYGVLLAKVLRLRSAADGYGPALEPAEGARRRAARGRAVPCGPAPRRTHDGRTPGLVLVPEARAEVEHGPGCAEQGAPRAVRHPRAGRAARSRAPAHREPSATRTRGARPTGASGRAGRQPWSTGPMPAPERETGCDGARSRSSLAAATADGTSSPSASRVAIAEASVQPVPWVCRLS